MRVSTGRPEVKAMIPSELTDCNQWVCWRTVNRNDKPAKMPINAVTGEAAACNDPTSWVDYATAVEACKARKLDGVGFAFADGDPYSGVDLDHCRDSETGRIAPWAREIIESLDSYTEVSPSQTCVKVFVRATLPFAARNRRAYEGGNVEMYSRLRFFTTTGQHLKGTPETVNERQQDAQRAEEKQDLPPPPQPILSRQVSYVVDKKTYPGLLIVLNHHLKFEAQRGADGKSPNVNIPCGDIRDVKELGILHKNNVTLRKTLPE